MYQFIRMCEAVVMIVLAIVCHDIIHTPIYVSLLLLLTSFGYIYLAFEE